MKFNGIIKSALPEVSGTTAAGKQWRRKDYVLVYDSSNAQYPKSILFSAMGDKIDELNIQQGGEYEVEIDFSTRDFNGKTYMSATVWKATALNQQPQSAPAPASDPYAAMGMHPEQAQTPKDDMGDPLPF